VLLLFRTERGAQPPLNTPPVRSASSDIALVRRVVTVIRCILVDM